MVAHWVAIKKERVFFFLCELRGPTASEKAAERGPASCRVLHCRMEWFTYQWPDLSPTEV